MTDSVLNVVVLAGGSNSPEMEAATGVTNRALVNLGAETMLSRVVSALHAADLTERIYVVGDVPSDTRYELVAGGETLLENLFAGLRAANSDGDARPVLASTSDIPFLTAESVDFFLRESLASGGDFCYPIIPISFCREHFPEMKRTTLRLREGTFTGGNMMVLNSRFLFAHEATITRAFAARKSVFKIGRMLGCGLLTRILAAQLIAPSLLTVSALEAGVSQLIGEGCQAHAVVTPYAEIGTDVDHPEDIAVANRLLAAIRPLCH